MINPVKQLFARLSSVLLICILLASCAPLQKIPDSHPVRMIFHSELNIQSKNKTAACKYLGTLVSSEGNWYNYLFMSNTDLTFGAFNDMHNKANAMNANVVYINNNIDFITSVTLVGQAYNCDEGL